MIVPSQKFRFKSHFSLLELTFALAVLIIGFHSLMSLLSAGMESSKTTIAKAHVFDAVEQFLYYISNEITNGNIDGSHIVNDDDWDDWMGALPDEKCELVDAWVGWSLNPMWQQGNVRIDYITNNLSQTDFDLHVNTEGLFRVSYTASDNTDEAQFSAVLRVWKDEVVDDIKVVLYAETSWPAEAPYPGRDKEYFSLEVFKTPHPEIN